MEKVCPNCGCNFNSETEGNIVYRQVNKQETFLFNEDNNTLVMRYSDDIDYI